MNEKLEHIITLVIGIVFAIVVIYFMIMSQM